MYNIIWIFLILISILFYNSFEDLFWTILFLILLFFFLIIFYYFNKKNKLNNKINSKFIVDYVKNNSYKLLDQTIISRLKNNNYVINNEKDDLNKILDINLLENYDKFYNTFFINNNFWDIIIFQNATFSYWTNWKELPDNQINLSYKLKNKNTPIFYLSPISNINNNLLSPLKALYWDDENINIEYGKQEYSKTKNILINNQEFYNKYNLTFWKDNKQEVVDFFSNDKILKFFISNNFKFEQLYIDNNNLVLNFKTYNIIGFKNKKEYYYENNIKFDKMIIDFKKIVEFFDS